MVQSKNQQKLVDSFDDESASDFIADLRTFLNTLPNLQLKDLQIVGVKAENLSLKLPRLEKHLKIKDTCYQCLRHEKLKEKEKKVAGDLSSVKSMDKIQNIDFIQKCLKQIENLEMENTKLKKSVRLQDIGQENRYEAAKMDKGHVYFSMEK